MIAVAGAFGYSGWQFFRPIEQCAPGSACAIPRIRRRRQTVFWISLPVAVTLVSSSYWIPLVA
jgi:mercuric ion transport protein